MKQKNWELPRCPYCGRRLSFWEAWVWRTQGEFTCPKCVSPSNIKFHQSIYGWAFFACLLGAGLLLVSLFLPKEPTLFGTILVLLPFLGFTVLAPNLMRLERLTRPNQKTAPAPANRAVYHTRSGGEPAQRPVSAQTMTLPALGKAQKPPSGKPAQPPMRPRQPGQAAQRPPLTYEQRRRLEQQRRLKAGQGQAANRDFVPPPKRSAAKPHRPAGSPIEPDFIPPYARRQERASSSNPKEDSAQSEGIREILDEFIGRYEDKK